jgi:hypothetical protein
MRYDKTIRVPHNFECRDYQKPLYNALADGYKRGVAVWHRRAGKDKTLINILVKEAFKRKGSYYYYFPTYSEGRKILWEGMDRDGMRFLDHIPRELMSKEPNSTEMKIDLINGSLIRIVGTDRLKIVGPNPVGCVFSEYSLQDPRAFDFIRPILAENDGWALFNYTPRGHNHGYKLYNDAVANPAWFSQRLTVDDTHAIPLEAINEERRAGMSEEMIQQEFYCSFESAVPGAYFAEQLRKAREDGRITNVPSVDSASVDTWWDLGMDDSTTIWFSQDVGREVHFIDYYENTGEGLQHYTQLLDQKRKDFGWIYGRHVGPHDLAVRELGTGGSKWRENSVSSST